jgi:hypothetical protein
MNRTQAIQSLTVQETIINALRGNLMVLERKLKWVAGEEWEEVKADIEATERALKYAYRLMHQSA